MMEDNRTSDVISIRVDKHIASKLTKICRERGTNVNDIVKTALMCYVRFADTPGPVDPVLMKAMRTFFTDINGTSCILADTNVRQDVMQAICIVGSNKRPDGRQLIMVDKPFFSVAEETHNVNTIIERVLEVAEPYVYRTMRKVAQDMGKSNLLDAIYDLFIDYSKDDDERTIAEIFSDCNRSDYGRKPVNAPYVRHNRRNIELDTQTHIHFDEFDKARAQEEVEQAIGGKPFGAEA